MFSVGLGDIKTFFERYFHPTFWDERNLQALRISAAHILTSS